MDQIQKQKRKVQEFKDTEGSGIFEYPDEYDDEDKEELNELSKVDQKDDNQKEQNIEAIEIEDLDEEQAVKSRMEKFKKRHEELQKHREQVNKYFQSLESKNENNWSVNHKAGMNKSAQDQAKKVIEEVGKNSEYHASE